MNAFRIFRISSASIENPELIPLVLMKESLRFASMLDLDLVPPETLKMICVLRGLVLVLNQESDSDSPAKILRSSKLPFRFVTYDGKSVIVPTKRALNRHNYFLCLDTREFSATPSTVDCDEMYAYSSGVSEYCCHVDPETLPLILSPFQDYRRGWDPHGSDLVNWFNVDYMKRLHYAARVGLISWD